MVRTTFPFRNGTLVPRSVGRRQRTHASSNRPRSEDRGVFDLTPDRPISWDDIIDVQDTFAHILDPTVRSSCYAVFGIDSAAFERYGAIVDRIERAFKKSIDPVQKLADWSLRFGNYHVHIVVHQDNMDQQRP